MSERQYEEKVSEDNIDFPPANNYLFKVRNRNTRKRYKIHSKLTLKTPERSHRRRSNVLVLSLNIFHISVVDFEQVFVGPDKRSTRKALNFPLKLLEKKFQTIK